MALEQLFYICIYLLFQAAHSTSTLSHQIKHIILASVYLPVFLYMFLCHPWKLKYTVNKINSSKKISLGQEPSKTKPNGSFIYIYFFLVFDNSSVSRCTSITCRIEYEQNNTFYFNNTDLI